MTDLPKRTIPDIEVPYDLAKVAEMIRINWVKPYFGAVPYIEAMAELHAPEEQLRTDAITDEVTGKVTVFAKTETDETTGKTVIKPAPYYGEDGYQIIRYFLSNASTWRGEVARAVKKDLNARLAEKKKDRR